MFLVFGLALIATAIQLFRHRNEDPSVDDNLLVAGARRLLPLTSHYHGGKIMARADGRRVLTPLFLVLVAIGSTDALFALDSIPAVFGVTQHAYIVFVANAFALLGLRAPFYLVSGLLDPLVYLSAALALIPRLHRDQAGRALHPSARAVRTRNPDRRLAAVIVLVLCAATTRV